MLGFKVLTLLVRLCLNSGSLQSQPEVTQLEQGILISASHLTFLKRHTEQAREPLGFLNFRVSPSEGLIAAR